MASTEKLFVDDISGQPQLDDVDINGFIRETNFLIESAGLILDTNDNTQSGQAMSVYAGAGQFGIDSGTPNNYVINPVAPRVGPGELLDGYEIRFFANAANTSQIAQLTYEGLGPTPLVQSDGSVLVIGSVVIDREITAVYKIGTPNVWELPTANLSSIRSQAIEEENLIINGHFVGDTYRADSVGFASVNSQQPIPVNGIPAIIAFGFLTLDGWIVSPGLDAADLCNFRQFTVNPGEPVPDDGLLGLEISRRVSSVTNVMFMRTQVNFHSFSAANTDFVLSMSVRTTAGTVNMRTELDTMTGIVFRDLRFLPVSIEVDGVINAGATVIPLSTTFQRFVIRFRISGDLTHNQAGAFNDDIYYMLEWQFEGTTPVFTVQIANVKMEQGTDPTPNRLNSMNSKTSLKDIDPFFTKSYARNTYPGDITDEGAISHTIDQSLAIANASVHSVPQNNMGVTFEPGTFNVRFYSPTTGAVNTMRRITPTPADIPVNVNTGDTKGVLLRPSANFAGLAVISYQFFRSCFRLPFIFPP